MPNTKNNQTGTTQGPSDAHDLDVVDQLIVHTVPLIFSPAAWKGVNNSIRVWSSESFPPRSTGSIPKESGVYVFVVEPNLFGFEKAAGLFYVGKAKCLFERIKAYIHELRITFKATQRHKIWKMIHRWNGHLHFYYTVTNNVQEAEILENEMINAYRPYFNKQYDAEVSPFMRAF